MKQKIILSKGCVVNMMELIKLEIRKNNLKPYLLGILGILLVGISIGVLFCATPYLEPNNPAAQEFANPSLVITMISVITMSTFSVLSAIMYSKIVIEEYTGKKNVLLFTYPQKRSNILLAKFLIIFTLIFVGLFTVNMVAIIGAGFISSLIGIISEPFNDISQMFRYSIIFSFVANFIGLIALRIGFYKKSIIVPIVVATALSSPFGNAVMMMGDNSISVFLIAGAVLLLISTFLFTGILKKVNEMECV